ncbi:hypothetical protein [Maritimibacter dapengensis]|uniref:DUF2946 domain-containing protein n=1 Tax=Maritimibacter dapengensis TaxID=2836868 RepID=A0ABS6T0Z7_9RHOB|nr:hypothetical protein [Maritimibacter dapengensis]MBV7378907.1 hypothetical protein [Maritimibacter dapengensis]
MRRANRVVLILSLVASLIAATGFVGYAKTAHALSAAGARTIVICGTAGEAEAITLDRNGDPIDDATTSCAHCADCTLVSVFVDPTNPGPATFSGPGQVAVELVGNASVVAREVEYPSRGPPSQKVV